MKLVRPSKKYQLSFLEAWREGQGERRYTMYRRRLTRANLGDYLRRIRAQANTKIWWLVEKNEYIGRVGVRRFWKASGEVVIEIRFTQRGKGYGNRALFLLARKARLMGKRSLEIQCRESNIASRRMIERLGGEFVKVIMNKEKENRLLYRLKLK